MSDTPITPPARVGFFGLGAMGCGMAVNLVKAGFTVSAYDPSADARAEFREPQRRESGRDPARGLRKSGRDRHDAGRRQGGAGGAV